MPRRGEIVGEPGLAASARLMRNRRCRARRALGVGLSVAAYQAARSAARAGLIKLRRRANDSVATDQ